MKELSFILGFFVAAACGLWHNVNDSDVQGDTWIEVHDCDGQAYEIVTSRPIPIKFLEEFCENQSAK